MMTYLLHLMTSLLTKAFPNNFTDNKTPMFRALPAMAAS